jgi:hypothetical protein
LEKLEGLKRLEKLEGLKRLEKLEGLKRLEKLERLGDTVYFILQTHFIVASRA